MIMNSELIIYSFVTSSRVLRVLVLGPADRGVVGYRAGLWYFPNVQLTVLNVKGGSKPQLFPKLAEGREFFVYHSGATGEVVIAPPGVCATSERALEWWKEQNYTAGNETCASTSNCTSHACPAGSEYMVCVGIPGWFCRADDNVQTFSPCPLYRYTVQLRNAITATLQQKQSLGFANLFKPTVDALEIVAAIKGTSSSIVQDDGYKNVERTFWRLENDSQYCSELGDSEFVGSRCDCPRRCCRRRYVSLGAAHMFLP